MSELKIVATILAKKNHNEDIKQALYTVVDETRKEKGNISYDLFQDIENPLKYTILETWDSQKSLDLHNQSEHFQNFIKAIENKFDSLEISSMNKIY